MGNFSLAELDVLFNRNPFNFSTIFCLDLESNYLLGESVLGPFIQSLNFHTESAPQENTNTCGILNIFWKSFDGILDKFDGI